MQVNLNRKLVAGVAAGLAAAGGGAAFAATQLGNPQAESNAIVNDVAGQLGISPERLNAALKKALENRVDAAVAAGRLTQEEGEALKARIEAGEVPLFGGHRGFGHFGFFHGLSAASSYLGLSESELRSQLADGKSLAQIARDRDKSVDGLVDALVAAAKERLDDAVDAGRLTRAQADPIAAGLEQRITDLVNRTPGRFFGDRRFGGPPPFALPGA